MISQMRAQLQNTVSSGSSSGSGGGGGGGGGGPGSLVSSNSVVSIIPTFDSLGIGEDHLHKEGLCRCVSLCFIVCRHVSLGVFYCSFVCVFISFFCVAIFFFLSLLFLIEVSILSHFASSSPMSNHCSYQPIYNPLNQSPTTNHPLNQPLTSNHSPPTTHHQQL